jgi:DNA-binding MarR family transcriptional regulator
MIIVNNDFKVLRMPRSPSNPTSPKSAAGLAFLLSQVGAHSAARFADCLAPLGLTPPQAGILRVIAESDALSQQALGEKLGMFPSRLVAVLDDLEARKLVERRNSPTDRRTYALHLTAAGRKALDQLASVSREHQDALCAALSEEERGELASLLRRIAEEQKLTPGVHPGYRKMVDSLSKSRKPDCP